MEKLLFLIVMFATCNAEPKDLTGKLFVFPVERNDYVQLLTSRIFNFSSATVCLRFITDTGGEYTLFSLSTPEHNHAFMLQKIRGDAIKMQVLDEVTHFKSVALSTNTWHSLCATWRSDNGLAQLRLNGIPTIKRYIKSGWPISGTPTITLGYDIHRSVTQPFVGMISKVHMWDYVVPAAQLRSYMEFMVYFPPGNVFNWSSALYGLKGQILVDEVKDVM